MNLKTINLKDVGGVEIALFTIQHEIEIAKLEKLSALKFLHGYGSGGNGGIICCEARKLIKTLKQNKKIDDYFFGSEWSLSNQKCFDAVTKHKIVDDDYNCANDGVTIVIF